MKVLFHSSVKFSSIYRVFFIPKEVFSYHKSNKEFGSKVHTKTFTLNTNKILNLGVIECV